MRAAYPRRMFLRFLLIIVVPMAITQAIAIFMFYERHWSSVSKHMTRAAAGDVLLLLDAAKEMPPEKAKASVDRASALLYVNAALYPPGAALPSSSHKRPSAPAREAGGSLLKELKKQGDGAFSMSYAHGYRLTASVTNGTLIVDVPYKRLANPSTYIFILWMAGTGAAMAGVAALFMRNQVRAVLKLADAMEHVGRGDFSQRFSPGGASEVRAAGGAFLAMKERIARFIRSRTDMLSGISHDLRTPITRLRLRLAMAPENGAPEGAEADLDEMERMIDGYLAYMRDERTSKGEEQISDVKQAVDEVVAANARSGVWIDVNIRDGLPPLALAPEAFARVLTNLLQNAIKYGKGVALISARQIEEGMTEISVEDNGDGVPEEARDDVFRPFYRVARAGDKHKSVGLGLSIVKDLTDGAGGSVRMEKSEELGGAKCVVALPSVCG
ncbi:MAG: ATP-binding protein [Rickettsiales bacterium]